MNINIVIAGSVIFAVVGGSLLGNWMCREVSQQRAHRAAVADVENFIYQQYPTIDAATRRGHAEILIDSSCVEIVENAIACQGGGLTKLPPEVRQYALRVAEAHGIKP